MNIERHNAQNFNPAVGAIFGAFLLLLTASAAFAKTNTIGAADGSFETDLSGTTATGDPAIVTRLGTLLPTEGVQGLLMTTQPDSGSTPADADVSTLRFGDFTIGAEYATLRLDYNFLTNEPDPSFANDAFTVTLVLVTAGGEIVELSSDTFDSFQPAVWSGYGLQTGFRTMVADVSAYAGSGDLVSLVLRIEDLGDGRRDSAVLVDDVRLVEPGVPEALVAGNYFQISSGEEILFDGSGSTDDVGIVSYEWDFDNGFLGFGPNVLMDQYTQDGFYQGTLTVTDADGFTDTATFTVVVGDPNSAPVIVSSPARYAAELVPYSYQIVVDDAEIIFGDTMTYALVSGPAGMSVDPDTGLVSWLPPLGIPVSTPVTLTVTDTFGESDSQSFAINPGPEVYVATVGDGGEIYTARSNGDGTFAELRFEGDISTAGTTRGVVIADFTGNDNFDLITGYPESSRLQLYLFEREAGVLRTPTYLGSFDTANPSYLMDMAAEDFDNDSDMDFVLDTNTARAWYFENTGPLVTEPENFFASDFETGNEGWGGQLTRTSLARDDTTSSSGDWSMRVSATGTPTQLSIDVNPTNWYMARGSTMRFDYRIPPGVPAGLLVNVTGRTWIWVGGAPAAEPGTFTVAPGAVTLIDDDSWHSVEIDLYQVIREVWPEAYQISEFEFWTNNNAVAGQQFWFDDFRITRPRMVSGFSATLLPDTGSAGRGMDAGDANNDGNMDFVRARSGGQLFLYTGDGAGNFTTSQFGTTSDPYGLVLADFDNDGNADAIAISNGSGDAFFYAGNGDGTFQAGVAVPELDINNYGSYGAYDFDDDGNQDIVISTHTSRQFWVYPGNGDGSFRARTLIGSSTSPMANILSAAAPEGRRIGQPFASATQDATDIDEGGTVNFDASASYDNGSIISYEWDFGDGNVGTGVTASNAYASEGTYRVVLTLTDNDGLQDTFALQVTVNGDLPVADPGGPYALEEAQALLGIWHGTLDGTASSDTDTSIAAYEWDFDASDGLGVDSTGPYPRPAYAATGVYTVTLTVYDEVGQSSSTTTTVTVNAGAPPVPDLAGPAALDETNASLGQWTGWYDASGSIDDIGAASYTIDWGDGTNATLSPLADDFEDGDFTANPAWQVSNGNTWSVINGEAAQTNTAAAWRWLQDPNRTYRDFQLDVDFMAMPGATDGYMGIAFRHPNNAGNSNAQNSFLLYSLNSWDFWRFYDWNTATVLQDGGSGWEPGIWYHLRLVVVGDTMQLFVTPQGGVEALQIEATSPAHPEGGVALMAYAQDLRYDNVKVTPLDNEWEVNGAGPSDFAKTYGVANTYPITLSVTDHSGQSAVQSQNTLVGAGAPPVADAGGPYTLDETDAFGGQWNLIVDASGSSDDTNVERYTVDFGDGTSYTSGFADGTRGSYFATGTDLYGFDTAGADLRRIVATEDNTQVEIINLANGAVIDSSTLNRLQAWDPTGSPPGDGVAYKVKATKPVVAYFTDLADHNTFVPSMDGDPVGKEFIFYLDENRGFNVYAFEDAIVTFYNTAGSAVAQRILPAGSYWPVSVTLNNADYRVVSTGRISMQTTGNNGFTTVPSDNGDGAGRLFYFATRDGTTESIAAFAHEAADVEVFDLDSGASLYTASIAAGDMWYQTGVGTRRLRLESTADVEVWAGDTEGGTAITSLGDDISFAGGRGGTEFVLHTLNDGVVIFAPNDNTDVDIDGGGFTATLQRDEFLRLTPADFPGGTGVHRIVTSQPVVIQTLGQANTYNDLGSYLGGVSMRHQYAATGTYTLTVTATDNAGQSDTTTTTVEVQAGDPPVPVIDAPAIADETFALGGQWTVDFDASGSTDDTGIFSYEWDFGDGTTGTGINPTHVYDAPGIYTVTLTVTDNAGQAVQTTQTVEVTFGAGPSADAGGPYVFGEEAASFGSWTATLDGTGSTDDAGIFDYLWTFDPILDEDFDTAPLDAAVWTADSTAVIQAGRLVDTGAGWGPRGHYSAQTYDRPGGEKVLSFTGQVLTPPGAVTDNMMWGVFNAAPTSFSYTQMNHAIYFNNGTLRIYEDGSQRASNVGSYQPGTLYDVRIDVLSAGARYFIREAGTASWIALTNGLNPLNRSATPLRIGASLNASIFEFDNYLVREELAGPIVTRTYSAPTVENATLTVRDNALQSDSDTTTITIEDGLPPVADAAGPYTAEVGSFINFNGTGSSDDTAVQQFDWTFGDLTGGPDAPGSQTANLPFTGVGPTPRHFYQATGSYTVELTVTDNTLKTDTTTTTVDVVVGDPPVAVAAAPSQAGANGPPAYFDARSSTDDFGIVEYRWDFDDAVDRDGDGDFTNDIDAVGPTPFHTYAAETIAAGNLLTDDFDGTAFDTTVWTGVGANQAIGVLSITGIVSWGTRYVSSIPEFSRNRQSFRGQISQSPGLSRMMWGVKNTTTSTSFNAMPHALYFNNGSLQIYENGSFRGTVNNFTYSRDTLYDVRIDTKSTGGADYYIRIAGGPSWTLLTGYTSVNPTTAPLKLHAVVYDGTGTFDNFAVDSLGPYVATLTVEDGAGQTSSTQIEVAVADNLPPNVITVPWVAFDPLVAHETYNGRSIRLKGIVRDADPVSYQWDFGDGTQSPVTAVTNSYDLSVAHTYPDAPSGTPFTATLTVTDAAGNTGSATYPVIVRPLNLTTEINVAIDEGLWYLHQQQTRTTAEGYDTGYWTSNARASATASAIQAFQINGHRENVSHQDDPYAETVMRGLRQLFRDLGTVNIATQTYGEPDTNGNGIGIQTGVSGSGGQPIYQGGQVMDAIASSATPLARTISGAAGIKRRSYFDILTDMTDQFAWGQTEQGSGGAWRYSWNSSIDNSAAQWGAIGMLAAEDIFGIPVPQWVKERNIVWIDRSYSGTGWGYTTGGPSAAGTPSALVQKVFDDQEKTDPQWRTGEQWISDTWTSQYIINPGNRPYYPYYALTKAMRLAKPEPVVELAPSGIDWFRDPDVGLARTLIDDQNSVAPLTGAFPGSQWIGGQLRSAWGVIILSRTLFVLPPVADAGRDRVWGVDLPLEFDGSASFHLDPFRSIVQYEWDFDGDGNFDLSSSDPTATFTYTSATYPEPTLPVTVTATLRVTDNNVPALTDTDTIEIIVAIPPHPPVAEIGGPYTCTAGLPCPLDGSGSFDIDPTDFITAWDWDLDGFPFDYDGTTGETPAPVFADPGQYNISLRVTDNAVLNDVNGNGLQDPEERLTDVDFGTVTVVENLAPIADANGPYTVDEGSTVTLDASGSSDPNGDPLTFLWDLDNDGNYDDALGPNPTYLGVDDGTYSVGLQVTDGVLSDVTTAIVIVTNVAPAVDAGPDQAVVEGATVPFNGNFTDPGTLDTHTIEWDFGDGTPTATGTLTPTHVYPDDGTFVVTLTVTDDDGGVGSDTLNVVVGNAIPAVDAGPDATLDEGDTFVSAGSFSDPGADTWTATVDYGDGSGPQPLALNPDGSFALDNLYEDDGVYVVTVTVTDDDGGVGSDTATVTVNNLAPIVEAGADQLNVLLGTSISLDPATFTDAGVLDTHTATIDWGDGTVVEPGTLTQGAGSGSVDGTHSYLTAGNYVVTVTVTDNGGASGFDSFAVEIVATPNTPPAVDAGPDATIDEGDTFVSAGSFTDPDADTWTATVDYGEGSGPQPLALDPDDSFALSNQYEDDGVYTVTVSVDDGAGGIGVDTAIVTVNNVAPTVDAGPDATLDEGDTFVSAGSFSDPGADTWTATVDYGDGSGPQPLALNPDGSFALDNLYEDDGVYVVTVTVTDDDSGVGSDTATVTVNNLAPLVDAGPDATLVEGDTFASAGAFSDPGADTWTATVDYGEGAGPQSLPLNTDGSFALGNLYDDDGVYVVTVTVTDDDGGVGSDTVTVTVDNAPPIVEAGADQSNVPLGTLITLDPATFTDAGVLDTHTATIDWGDGTVVEPGTLTQGAGSGTVDGTHSYAAGNFVVTVTVTDNAGASGSDSFAVEIVPTPNTPPTVDAGPDASIDEGDTFVSAGSFTDPDADTWTATVDYGEGAGPQTLPLNPDGTFALSNQYEDDGVYTVTVSVDDGAGGIGVDTAIVTVNNVAPTVDAGPDATLDEGDTFASAGSFNDPGADTWTATVDYGEGAGPQSLPLNTDGSFALGNLYEDDGVYVVTVTVTDDDGGVGSDTATVTVNNLAPLVDAGPDATLVEGDTFASAGAFSDPGADTWTATVDYGEGAGPQSLPLNTDGSFALGNLYDDDGVYVVTVTVTDDDGGVGSDTVTVTVDNAPPIVEAGADQSNVPLGTLITLDPATFTDAGVLDTHTATIDWGDGTVVEPGTLTQGAGSGTVDGTHSYAAGNFVVTVTVTDNAGASGSDSFAVEIVPTPNTPPTVDAGPDASIDEGDTFVSAGSFTDPDTDTWTATVDYGEGAGPQTLPLNPDGTFALSNQYADDGVYTVTVSVDDGAGGVGVDTAIVTVNNVAPSVDAGPDATIDEGDTFASAGSFNDPGADTWTATVDYGDGSGVQPLALNPDKTFALSHTYVDDGVYTVTVTVTDDDGGVGSDTATSTVRDVGGQPPEPPIGDLFARAKDSKIDLVWAPMPGATGYNVYRSTTQGGPYDLIAANHQCDYCAYADFGLTNGTTYYYVVTWTTSAGESANSNEASATPAARRRR